LLLASVYGFKKIIGVEFIPELHKIALDNIIFYKNKIKPTNDIVTICEDAVNFPIPNRPLVIFFYSPFKGKVMEQVLTNISTSLTNYPRKIIMIFYGNNPATICRMKSMDFSWVELKLKPDWKRLRHYHCFIFTSDMN